MKTILSHIAAGLAGILFVTNVMADPIITSWLTTYAGQYARVYLTDTDKTNGTDVTTWSRNALSQSLPVYAGVREVYSSANWVYIRTPGLGIHTMGPWYTTTSHTNVFMNVPVNSKMFYRIPRTPVTNSTHNLTGGGPIGYFVDGVAMFDSRDAFYWNGSTEAMGSGSWNRDAYVNESQTFDPALAHQPGNGQYHYHANAPALRYLLGDHVNFNSTTKMYSESTNAVTQHSPILGWVRDGLPIYGPYGYATATNASSGVRRIISGYVLRNGAHGTDNIGRTFLGTPTGSTPTLAEPVTTNFIGGANSALSLAVPVVSNNIVTLTWSATEGGTYRVEATGNLSSWTTNASGITAVRNKGTTNLPTTTHQFFRVTRTALAPYDTN